MVGLAEVSRWLCVGPFPVGMVGDLERGGEGDIMSRPSGSMFEVIGFEGVNLMGESRGAKSRAVAKWPKPPRWSTVKGTRAMWWAFKDWMTDWVEEALVVLP